MPVLAGGSDQAAITALDGSGYRCITCGRASSATKLNVLDDGRRMWFANNGNGQEHDTPLPFTGGTSDVQWQMLECAPSVYDCRDARVLDVDFPTDSLAEGAQNREADPDPFGEFVVWNEVSEIQGTRFTIARLVRGESSYALADPRVIDPPYGGSDFASDWVPGGRFYEGGDWIDGGRAVKFQTTTTGLNYDTWTFSLQTGEFRQMTTDLDYNELGSYSPDGRWLWYSSARGLDRMDVFTAVERPSLLDGVAFGQIGRVSLWNNRRCMNEGWLMSRDVGQQRGGYAGQPVLLEDDWNLRQWEWFADGTRALVEEERLPNRAEPADPAARKRVSIVRLPARRPTRPLDQVHVGTLPWQRFTTPSADYETLAARQLQGKVLRGRAAGTVTLTNAGAFAAGRWSAKYENYSDDGRSFVDGTESLGTPNPVVLAFWDADLRVHGEHNGYLSGHVAIEPQNRFSGSAESEVDGRHYAGIPVQADCPGLHQPTLRFARTRVRALGGGRRLITVTVVADVAEDATPRPVRFAAVRAGGHSARTDARGVARLVVRGRPPLVTAGAGGFKPTAATLNDTGG